MASKRQRSPTKNNGNDSFDAASPMPGKRSRPNQTANSPSVKDHRPTQPQINKLEDTVIDLCDDSTDDDETVSEIVENEAMRVKALEQLYEGEY